MMEESSDDSGEIITKEEAEVAELEQKTAGTIKIHCLTSQLWLYVDATSIFMGLRPTLCHDIENLSINLLIFLNLLKGLQKEFR